MQRIHLIALTVLLLSLPSPALAQSATPTAAPATTTASKANGPFHGNVSSRVYHSSSCKNYSCKSCTAVFESEDAAKRAGYLAAGDCIGK